MQDLHEAIENLGLARFEWSGTDYSGHLDFGGEDAFLFVTPPEDDDTYTWRASISIGSHKEHWQGCRASEFFAWLDRVEHGTQDFEGPPDCGFDPKDFLENR